MSLRTSASSQITHFTLLSDTPTGSTQSTIPPEYRRKPLNMGSQAGNAEAVAPPPAAYYDPYPSFTPQPRLQQERIAVQQNDKSGETTIPIALLGRYQAPIECPACSRRTVTTVKHKNGKGTHTWAGILFLTTFVGAVVPYAFDYFKNVQHRCGRCGVVVATNHFSSGTEAHVH